MKLQRGNKFIIAGIVISILSWIVESVLHVIFFQSASLLNQIFSPGIHEIWTRTSVVALILLLSYFAKKNLDAISKQVNIEDFVKTQRDVSIRLGLDENIDDTLKTCLDAAIEISGMDSGGIYFISEVTGEMTLVHYKGVSDKFIETSKYFSADSEKTLLVNSGVSRYFSQDELNEEHSNEQKEEGICSLAVVPIQSGGKVIAALNIASHGCKEMPSTVRDAIEGMAAQIGSVIDKARKANELIESEAKYRSIVENAHEGILIIGSDYRFSYVNDESCRILQRGREELLGHDFREFLDEESRMIVSERYKRRQRGEDVTNRYEFNIVRKSGEKRNVELSASVIQTDKGPLSVALILDLSLRKRAEMKYKTLFESSKDAIAVIKPPDWKFITGNPAAFELFNIKNQQELIAKTPWGMSQEYQPDGQRSYDKGKKMIALAMRDGGHFFEWMHIDSGGSLIPTTVYLVRIEIEGEDCLLATMRDISESKEIELQMKRLRDYLTSIINSMPSVLIGVDVEGLVTHWNKEAEKITGIAAGDARGRSLLEVYPDLEGEMDNVKMAISSGEIQKDLKVVRYINDDIYYKDITVYPIRSGDVSGAVIREDDVTERKKLEDIIVQAEKMTSLGGLAAGMAHEINTPLTVIIQNAAIVLNRLMEDIPGNIQAADEFNLDLVSLRKYVDRRSVSEMIDGIRMSGKRAAEIVRDMLSFARKELSEKSANSVNDLINNSVDLARQDVSLDLGAVNIRFDYDSSLPDIMCEPSKIKQVFFNILKNGAEAMKKKKGKEYNPEFILRTYRDDDWACIEIEDNGPGIDESVRKRVFEPFFTTKGEGEGAGLGMSVSYFIITDIHAGMMEVESREGEWTRFVIKLPFDR